MSDPRYLLNFVDVVNGVPVVTLTPVGSGNGSGSGSGSGNGSGSGSGSGSGTGSGSGPSVSPTGRQPKLLWTPGWQQRYAAMVANNDPLWLLLKSKADKAVAGTPDWGTIGQYCAIAYQVTGDQKYARSAFNLLTPILQRRVATNLNANEIREVACEAVVCLEWIMPALTNDELNAILTDLDAWADFALAKNMPVNVGGFRVSDNDQTVGQYFFLAAMDKAFGRSYLAATDMVHNLAVGGLSPTNTGTVRDSIARYAFQAQGGVWFESSNYNIDTLTILLLGIAAVGREHFPEYESLYVQFANAQLAEITPDNRNDFQWGDNEQIGINYDLFYRLNLLWMLTGMCPDDVASELRGGISHLVAANSTSPYASPWWRAFWLSTPGTEKYVVDRTVNSAVGVFLRRTADELFAVLGLPPTFEDHANEYGRFGDVSLYIKDEWVLYGVIGYGGSSPFPEAGNCAMLCGLGPMASRKSFVDVSGKIICETDGAYYQQPYYDPPPAFLRLYQREISRDGRSIVLHDVIDMDDARKLPKLDRYRAPDQSRITTAADDLVQLVFHCPVQPTVSTNAVSWKTPGGKTVTVSWSDQRTVKVIDETVLWLNNNSVINKAWQIRLIPVGYTGGKIDLTTRIDFA